MKKLICLWLAAGGLLCAQPGAPSGKGVREHLADLPFAMPALEEPVFPDRQFSITDYGGVAGGQALNTEAFARAIRACTDAGGGTVVVPPGTWLTGAIRLESNVNLHVERGALVQFSRRFEDFPLIAGFDGKSDRYIVPPPIHAYREKNIAITGPGVFDGAGEAWRYVKKEKLTAGQWKDLVASGGVVTPDGRQWWPSQEALNGQQTLQALEQSGVKKTAADYAKAREFLRPDLVRLVQCTGILIDGPTFQNSPRFHVYPFQSENIIVRNVQIRTAWHAQNGDGLDFGSCRNVLVYNTTVDAGDDAICLKPGNIASSQAPGPACENIVIADCIVYHGHGGFVIGSESNGGARNVVVRNCLFVGTDVGLRFKSARGKGGLIENILIDGIQMRDIANEAILFDMYYDQGSPEETAGRGTEKPAKPVDRLTPRFRDFTIRNVTCLGASRAVLVNGLPEMPVANIRIEHATMTARKGVLCVDADSILLDDMTILSGEGPVVSLVQSRNVVLSGMTYPEHTGLFLSVAGTRSAGIRLENIDLSRAARDMELGDGVRPEAVEKRP